MNNKHIMLVIPFLALAGAEIMVVDLAKGLKEAGYKVSVTSLYTYDSVLTDELQSKGIQVFYLDKKRGYDLRLFGRLYHLIKQEKPDVIHTHLNVVKYVMPVAIRAKIFRCFHTVHNVADREQRFADRFITRVFCKHFGLTLVGISPSIKQTILDEYALQASEVPMIYNGRNLSSFVFDRNYSDHDIFTFLHVGRFSEQKNHRMLLEAFNEVHRYVPSTRLKLVGEGEKENEIKDYTIANSLQDVVDFVGVSSNVNIIMNECDAFVLPSLYEGMPITLIEAMANGLPIIATKVGGIEDMLNSESAILIDVDKEQLIKAMLNLLNSPSLRKTLGKNAKYESRRFSYEEMTKNYLQLYKI